MDLKVVILSLFKKSTFYFTWYYCIKHVYFITLCTLLPFYVSNSGKQFGYPVMERHLLIRNLQDLYDMFQALVYQDIFIHSMVKRVTSILSSLFNLRIQDVSKNSFKQNINVFSVVHCLINTNNSEDSIIKNNNRCELFCIQDKICNCNLNINCTINF